MFSRRVVSAHAQPARSLSRGHLLLAVSMRSHPGDDFGPQIKRRIPQAAGINFG
jgi:hypothetical protein